MKHTTTQRGFRLGEFEDRNGVTCSVQESSIATERCIWLGCDDLGLVHLVPGRGWVPVENLPPTAQGNTRMHLTRKQVAMLVPVLQHFVDHGELPDGDDK